MSDFVRLFVTFQLVAVLVVNNSVGRSIALYTLYQFFSYFWPHQQRSTLQVILSTSYLVLFSSTYSNSELR
jgi:hypothetical protein